MKKLTMIFLVIFLFSSQAFCQEAGKIVSAQGRVDIFKEGSQSAVPAIGDDLISVGDSIRTKSGSKALVIFRDKSVLKLAQNSKVLIKDYQLDEKDRRKSAVVELSRGKARAIIAKTPSGAGFVIKTPNAEGTVKGSDVTAFYQAGNSGMFVSEGKLSVINIAHPKDSIIVPKGNACVIPMGELPKGPRPYLDVEKKLNDEDTYIPVSISKTGKVSVIKGAVAKVSGMAKITSKGSTEAHKASINDILGEGDRIETGENGYIEIRLDNNNCLNLKPNTKLTIIKLVINPETGEFENIFEVTMGKIKARIENLKGNSKFEVRTPQAVCGARGTIMYVDITANMTTSFFEGGNGYMTNTLTDNTRDIPPGTSSTSDASGNVSNPAPLSDSDRQSYGEGWDPGSGTEGYSSPEGNASTGAFDSDTGANTAGDAGGMATTDPVGGTAGGAPPVDVPFTESNPTPGESSSLSSATEETVNFRGYFGHVAEDPSNAENPNVVTNGVNKYVIGQLSFTLPSTQDWTRNATYGSDGVWVAVTYDTKISETYDNSPNNKLWIVTETGHNNDQIHITTSGGGAIRAWMGGRVVQNGLSGDIFGKIFGIYVDPSGNGGTFYSSFDGTVDAYGNYICENNGDRGVDEAHFTKRKWNDTPVSAAELFNAPTEQDNLLYGKGNGSFTVGPDPDSITAGSIICDHSGRTLELYRQGWGVWRMQMMGTYSGASSDYHGWTMMLGGTSPGSTDGDPSYWFGKAHSCYDCQETPWVSGILNSDFKGYWLSPGENYDSTKSVKLGIIEEGDIWGNYAPDSPGSDSGTWEALGGGEWYEATDLFTEGGIGFTMTDFDGFVNVPITEVYSTTMTNITGGAANFSSVSMSPTFYTAATAPVPNLWFGQILGEYITTNAPTTGWTLAVSNDGNTAALTDGTWSGGVWHATVNGNSDSSTITYSGEAGGTYDPDGKFQGGGAGTWSQL